MQFGSKLIRSILFSFLMLILILEPQRGLTAALSGIDLCLKSVIPGMFPLLFLSSMLACELSSYSIPLIEHILHIPTGSAGNFLIGLVCGYPVGAKLIQKEIDNRHINVPNANRMMIFCNNASPAFIIGILAPVFENVWFAISLWLIQIIGSILVGVLWPEHDSETVIKRPMRSIGAGANMMESTKAISAICGWIILFGVLLAYLEAPLLSRLSSVPGALLNGALELTNGIFALRNIYSPAIRFIICSILLSFGGLCIFLQTKSVAPSINIKNYIYGRLFHTCITGTLSSIFCLILFPSEVAAAYCLPLFFAIFIMSLIILYFNKKMVAFK